MRIQQVDLLLSASDLTGALEQRLPPGALTDLQLQSEEGVLRVGAAYQLGFSIPVELALTVAGLSPEQVELAASLRAGVALPGLATGKVLAYLVQKAGLPGLRASGTRLLLEADDLGPGFSAWFRFRHLEFTAAGIEVGLDDLMLLPLGDLRAAASDAPPAGVAPAADPTPPPATYRDGYDKLRQRIAGWADLKVPERYRFLLPWLLLLPDLFALLGRLTIDPRVSTRQKVKLAAAIAYVISPVDLIPDFIPFAGITDDLGIVLLALADFLDGAPRQVLLEQWAGDSDILELIPKGLRLVRSLGGGLLGRLKAVLQRR